MTVRHPIVLLAAVLVLGMLAPARSPAKPARPPRSPAPATSPAATPAPAAPAPADAPPPGSGAASPGARALDEARRLYGEAKFQDAIAVLTQAIRTGQVTGDDVVQARALRGRCLVKVGRRLEAKEAFKAILRIDRQFRLDPNIVPPDEVDVYKLAAQEIDSEEFEAGQRFPSSIGFTYGQGNAVNQDLVDLASSAGTGVPPADDFAELAEFSYSVRFPLHPGLSIDFEVTRLKATTADKLPVARNAHATYTASALPFVLSLVHTLYSTPVRHLNGFVGVGPIPSEAIIEYRQTLVAGRLIPDQIVGHNQGWYFHAGLEGEWMVRPRFAITGRVLGRRANSGDLHWPRDDFQIYESWDNSTLTHRTVDFSGVAASIGLRAYIGY